MPTKEQTLFSLSILFPPTSHTSMKLSFAFSFFFFSSFISCSHSTTYNALFNFGDSMSDTGNVNMAPPPYGMTYFNRTTGRCSDGRLVIDFIAEGLGLPHLPPNKAENQSFQQGANFAWVAATALDFDFFAERSLTACVWVNASLNFQIDNFEKALPSICGSPQECKDYFKKALFIVGEFGGNDYTTGIFLQKPLEEVSTYRPFVTQAISDGVERLIGFGAVDIVVPSLIPIGCFPLYLSFTNWTQPEDFGPKSGCMRKYNTLTWYHNTLLREKLEILRKKYPSVTIRYADYYSQIMDFAINPLKYGFTDGALRACCGSPGFGNYNYNPDGKCDSQNHTVCKDPSTHVSWDGIHFTEAANRHIANGWLHGPYISPPILTDSDSSVSQS